MAVELRGAPVARAMLDGISARIASLKRAGVTPTLAFVRVGERPDDLSYERAAERRCAALGINTVRFALPADCSQEDLLEVIGRVNEDSSVHGCLMFRPLPSHLDEDGACEALLPEKDVDGITRASAFGVYANREVGFAPCTAEACVRLLDHYGVALEGTEVVVVGRSLVIGKPVSMLLQARGATVTMCHTKTRDLPSVCRSADVVVVAAGHPGTVGAAHVREGQVIIDVGINWSEERGRLVGDVAYDEVEPKVSAVTPVPGGVGSITVAVLAEHVVRAAERSVRKR